MVYADVLEMPLVGATTDVGIRVVTIMSLSPNTVYDVRVRAINFYGIGEASSPLEGVLTGVAAPRVHPTGFGGGGGKVGTLNVTWDSFPRKEWGSTNGWFEIWWLYVEAGSSGTPTKV